MADSFYEEAFRQRLASSLKQVELVLESSKASALLPADQVPHRYDDKYLLAEQLVGCGIAALWNTLRALGLTEQQFARLKAWQQQGHRVSIRVEFVKTCVFDRELVREESVSHRVEVQGLFGTKHRTTTVVTKITDFQHTYACHYRLIAVADADMVIAEALSQQSCLTHSMSCPHPNSTVSCSTDITWLLSTFSIVRDSLCYTPRRNREVEQVLGCWADLTAFAAQLQANTEQLLEVHRAHHSSPLDMQYSGLFDPVLPVLLDDGTVLGAQDLQLLLDQHMRCLQDKLMETSSILPQGSIISPAIAQLAVAAEHVLQLAGAVGDGLGFIEHMLRAQLIAAIGRELTPNDLAEYMAFHYRKLFRRVYQPVLWVHAVRRSPAHCPEGTLSIVSQATAIAAFIRTLPLQSISFALSSSCKVSCSTQPSLHCWLGHSFSDALPELQLVAQARQFASYAILIGRMINGQLFDPKHAFIARDKEEWQLPLLLEAIPTPKQFRDAIESLSPEQQRFAQAFRSMQLESTLFAVCVVQIKPQLEKVLRLSADSLTKEIRLTQDLMALFTEYQIPPDLLAFDGPSSATATERVDAVKGHVRALHTMLQEAKDKEIKTKRMSRVADYGRCERLDTIGVPQTVAISFAKSTHRLRGNPSGVRSVLRMMTINMSAPSMAKGSMANAPSSPMNSSAPAPEPAAGPPSAPVDAINEAPKQQHVPTAPAAVASSSPAFDVMQLPAQLDAAYLALDVDSSLRPTIINVGPTWQKRAQAALLANAHTSSLGTEEQGREKQAAFDLLDALTRSGALELADASLHVVIAATHSFDQTLMDSVICRNLNPIERVERSALIMASVLHGQPGLQLVRGEHHNRLLAKHAESAEMVRLLQEQAV